MTGKDKTSSRKKRSDNPYNSEEFSFSDNHSSDQTDTDIDLFAFDDDSSCSSTECSTVCPYDSLDACLDACALGPHVRSAVPWITYARFSTHCP